MTTGSRNANRNSHRCVFCGSLFPQNRLMRPPGQSRGGICFDCIRELANYVAERGGKQGRGPATVALLGTAIRWNPRTGRPTNPR